MELPKLDDPGAKRGCKFGAFGSVGMSMVCLVSCDVLKFIKGVLHLSFVLD